MQTRCYLCYPVLLPPNSFVLSFVLPGDGSCDGLLHERQLIVLCMALLLKQMGLSSHLFTSHGAAHSSGLCFAYQELKVGAYG